jgi:hypothetical protein
MKSPVSRAKKQKPLDHLARLQAERIGFDRHSKEADFINYGFAKGYALAMRRINSRTQ